MTKKQYLISNESLNCYIDIVVTLNFILTPLSLKFLNPKSFL